MSKLNKISRMKYLSAALPVKGLRACVHSDSLFSKILFVDV